MVVVMSPDASQADIDSVVELVRTAGGEAFVSRGVSRTIVGLVGDVEQFSTLNLQGLPGVTDVVRISVPYKLVSREHHRARSVIRVRGVPIGPDTLTVIAGPCAVETPEQTLEAARMARAGGASLLRGGAFKPRSSPYAFQGLGDTRPQLISSTVRLITYVIPTLWLSARSGFRVEQIWYLSIATTTMQALLSLWLLSRELGKRLVFSPAR